MKTTRRITLLLLALLMIASLISCNRAERTGVWEDATYQQDKTFGKGEKVIEVEVKAEDQSVTFTVKTDKENLADAMLEHGLVEGEQGPYGLYIKKVNGMEADFDKDGYYWSLSKGGVPSLVGASGTAIADGEHYEFTRTK